LIGSSARGGHAGAGGPGGCDRHLGIEILMTALRRAMLASTVFFSVAFGLEFLRLAYREYFPPENPYVIAQGPARAPELWTYRTTAAGILLLITAGGFLVAQRLAERWTRLARSRDLVVASAVVALVPVVFLAWRGMDRVGHLLGLPVGPPRLVVVLGLGIVCGVVAAVAVRIVRVSGRAP
jgi:hypothetical protein